MQLVCPAIIHRLYYFKLTSAAFYGNVLNNITFALQKEGCSLTFISQQVKVGSIMLDGKDESFLGIFVTFMLDVLFDYDNKSVFSTTWLVSS